MKLERKIVAYRIEAGRSAYEIRLVNDGLWEAEHYMHGLPATCVSAYGEDGELTDWPSVDEAHRACEMHAALVEVGVDPVIAVLDVQRALREGRAA